MNEDLKYGIPQLKKFPMPDKKHVFSAIKFFNYVTPKYEKQLAKAILSRMKEYGMSFEDVGVGNDNRFKKYIPESGELAHHGILGMKWGVRRYQNKDGSLTAEGKKHREDPNYYPFGYSKYGVSDITRTKYDRSMTPSDGKYSEAKTVDEWKNEIRKNILSDYKTTREIDRVLEKKEYSYSDVAKIIFNEMYKNPYNFKNDKSFKQEQKSGDLDDSYANNYSELIAYELVDDVVKDIYKLFAAKDGYGGFGKNELKHHGILGQKWGVRRYQNPDGSLTPAGMKRRAQQIDKSNAKYLKKYGDTINKKVEKAVEPYMKIYAERELNTTLRKLKKNGKDSRNYINAYNKRLAQLMNTAVGDLRNPNTDYVVQFIAKRGEYGVHTALAAPGTDMSRYGRGVYADGRIAYRKEGVKTV